MIEILILIALTKKIGSICEDKGHSAGKYKLYTVLLWFGGEIGGGILGAIIGDGEMGMAYILALVGAITGAVLSFVIANNLPDESSDLVDVFE